MLSRVGFSTVGRSDLNSSSSNCIEIYNDNQYMYPVYKYLNMNVFSLVQKEYEIVILSIIAITSVYIDNIHVCRYTSIIDVETWER